MAPDCAYQTKVFERLRLPRGVTAIVGGGGKTTLMERLALELAAEGHTVLVTTTTRIFPPAAMPVLLSPTPEAVSRALRAHAGEPVCVGAPAQEGKLQACSLPIEALSRLAAYVLVEADGAKHLPLKAPASHEPVIPETASLVLAVAGLDGIGKPVSETAFRPERYAAVLGVEQAHVVTPQDVAAVLMSGDGQRKDVRPGVRFSVVLNKADDAARQALARQVAAALPRDAVDTVLCTSLCGGNDVCLCL